MTTKPWTERQAEIRRILDRIIQATKDKGVPDRELVALEDVAMKSFEVLETLNDAGQITEDESQEAVLPLALANLAVLLCRSMDIPPLDALRQLTSVFTLHSGIVIHIVRMGPDGQPMEEDKGLTEQTLRSAITSIMGRKTPTADDGGQAPVDPQAEADTQKAVEALMASVWDTDKMTVN